MQYLKLNFILFEKVFENKYLPSKLIVRKWSNIVVFVYCQFFVQSFVKKVVKKK